MSTGWLPVMGRSEIMPELKKTLGTLDLALRDADKILVRADEELVPGVKNTLESLQAAVDSAAAGPGQHGHLATWPGRAGPAGTARDPAGGFPRRARGPLARRLF